MAGGGGGDAQWESGQDDESELLFWAKWMNSGCMGGAYLENPLKEQQKTPDISIALL